MRSKISKLVLIDLMPFCFHVIIVSRIILKYASNTIRISNGKYLNNSFMKHILQIR